MTHCENCGCALKLPVWMDRKEAAEYLRVSVETIDRRLTPIDEPVEGRLRYTSMKWDVKRVRILAEDVYSVLPHPETIPVKEAA